MTFRIGILLIYSKYHDTNPVITNIEYIQDQLLSINIIYIY